MMSEGHLRHPIKREKSGKTRTDPAMGAARSDVSARKPRAVGLSRERIVRENAGAHQAAQHVSKHHQDHAEPAREIDPDRALRSGGVCAIGLSD